MTLLKMPQPPLPINARPAHGANPLTAYLNGGRREVSRAFCLALAISARMLPLALTHRRITGLMLSPLKWFARHCIVVLCLTALIAPPASAQRGIALARDTEIENDLLYIVSPILRTAGIPPESVRIGLVQADSLNAFVAGGQNIFFHAGLLMDVGLDELVGVSAHEIGHIAGGHLARSSDAIADAQTMSTLVTLLGLAAALGAGRSDIGLGIIGGGQEAALRNFLSFTRAQEGSADEAAMSYLEQLGWSSRGLLKMMERLAGQELLPETRQAEYVRTHPLTRNRVDAIKTFIETRSNVKDHSLPMDYIPRHARMQAKLLGFIRPKEALRHYDAKDASVPARYGRAIALYRTGQVREALALVDGLIAQAPKDAYFQELKGQILFEEGQTKQAVPPYRQAALLDPESGLIRQALAQALLETGDDRLLDETIGHLMVASRLEPDSAIIWRLLASAYDRANRPPLLAFALAEEALARGDIRVAKFHADRAERLLPPGSPEWLRAQDIRVLLESSRASSASR
jgi:predicted Zn-dependent protease